MTTTCLRVVVLSMVLVATVNAQLNSYNCQAGKDAVVHLFEWKYTDIQNECAWLASKGYCAVQISPPQEAIVRTGTCEWWTRYQPVSYQLTSRSGTEAQLVNMVQACNNVGVRIYADIVINHMTGGGSGTGTAGNSWNGGGDSSTFWGGQYYPGVPFAEGDFNPPGSGPRDCATADMNIANYGDTNEVRNCRLVGLRDLAMLNDYVRSKIAEYMNRLIGIGVAGFRVDACKHMYPSDLQNIYGRLNNLNTNFPGGTRPYVYQEVIDMGGEVISASEYTGLGRVTEFKYGSKLSDVVLKANNERLAYLVNFGEAWGFMSRFDALAFVDNHDNQRGHGGGGEILSYKSPREYKIAVAFMLAWDYGHARVMSSYDFTNTDQGPPSDSNCNIQDVVCFDGGQWICEHRWRPIYNMVLWHAAALGQSVQNWWDNGFHAIAFSRGNRAFIVINNEATTISQTFQTGLPGGDYCNVILCDNNRPPCSGAAGCSAVTVNGDGTASISVPNSNDPMVAIYN